MFESDDYDQILSQLDFTAVINTDKHVTKTANVSDLENIPSDVNNLVEEVKLGSDIRNVYNNKYDNERNIEVDVPKNNYIKERNTSPKHTKRRIIDSHFSHKNKRKFPGPAGLLTGTVEETKSHTLCQIELLSQDLDSSQNHLQRHLFETPLWKRLIEDTKGLNCNSIKMIKQHALSGNLRRRKADIVRGFVESIDRSAIDPLITLRDTTGCIKCTLHRDAWSHFSPYIVSEYCALILQKPTVLTTGSAFKKHYLNITLGNISHIYSSILLNTTEELPEGFVKILNEFTLIKSEKQITELDFSPSNDTNDILEGLDAAFLDTF